MNWIKKVRIQESPWGADLRIPEEVAVKRCFWEGWGLELCQLCITYDQLNCWNREATRWWRRRWKRKRQAERLTAGYQVNAFLIQPCTLHACVTPRGRHVDHQNLVSQDEAKRLSDCCILMFQFDVRYIACFSLVLRSFPAYSQFDISPTLAWLKQNFASGKGKGKMSVKVIPHGVVYASFCWDFPWQATLICIRLHFHDPFWCGSIIWGQKSSFSNIYETQTTIIRSSPDFKWHHLQIVSVYHVCKFEDWCWVSSSRDFMTLLTGADPFEASLGLVSGFHQNFFSITWCWDFLSTLAVCFKICHRSFFGFMFCNETSKSPTL